MTLFIILSLGTLYFLMFLLISIHFRAFLYTLVHSWCKQSQLELRNCQFCFRAETVPRWCSQWPWGKSLRRAEAAPTRICSEHPRPTQCYKGLSYPKPRWQGSAPSSRFRCGASGWGLQHRVGCRVLVGNTQTLLYLTTNTQVFVGLL